MANSDGLVTAWVTDGGIETRCRTDDGRVQVSPGRARVRATLDDCWLGTGPIAVDLTWKPVAPPTRTHINEWDPTEGCGNPPLGWTARYVYNRWQTEAATAGFIDGEPFEGYSPFMWQDNSINVAKNRMTCCGDCPADWPT